MESRIRKRKRVGGVGRVAMMQQNVMDHRAENAPRMTTEVVPSPTSSSWERAVSIRDLAAGWCTIIWVDSKEQEEGGRKREKDTHTHTQRLQSAYATKLKVEVTSTTSFCSHVCLLAYRPRGEWRFHRWS